VFAPTIPLLDNTFTTFPLLRGQPQVFAPGSHAHVFSTTFSSGTSAWRLNGSTANARATTSRCP
jgi:hypothetical protein